MRSETLGRDHFERLYSASPDPWHVETSPYEQAKYAATLAALPHRHYGRALEVGCSIGVMTEQLAPRCGDLLAVEAVEAALDRARRRNARFPHVRFAHVFVPADWPDELFDLVVISEVLDYLGADDLKVLAARIGETLRPDGDLVLVHWVGKKGPVATSGEATEGLIAAAADALIPIRAERNRDYRLDVLRRRGV